MMRRVVIPIAAVLCAAPYFAQAPQALLDQAKNQFLAAQKMDAALHEKAAAGPSRADALKAIDAYQRVYLITPHTGYADDALLAVARLYEEIRDTANAVKTLKFLVRDYPATPYKSSAERDIARLESSRDAPIAPTAQASAPDKPVKTDNTVLVENVRYWEAQNSVRVVVDISGEIQFKQGEAKSPNRVFIDIPSSRLSPTLLNKQWPVQLGLLQQIRVGQFDNSTVRVVLDVGAIDSATSFTLREPDRLIIDVFGQAGASPPRVSGAMPESPLPASAAPTSPVRPPAALTAANAGTPPVALPPASPVLVSASPVQATPTPQPTLPPAAPPEKAPVLAQPANRGGASLVRSLGLKISRVVIDAGHGGHDTGTIGPTGYTEKELVLDVARRLKALIETEMGAEVVMTRGEDVFVPLESRTAIANQNEADLFISIHANASKVASARGVETFYLNYPPSRDALELASRENASSQATIHELEDIVKRIMLNDKANESRELAGHIQKALADRKDAGPDRGVKEAPFVVLIGARMPSILAEVGFISNPQEERSVKTPAYRQQIAESLIKGIRSYADTLAGVKSAVALPK
jgi:N-acetylmuramoyl-L-alanine amidase